ncbi:TcaA 3rd/4th domain-containing protein [Kurthia senegalensis]|uniref:TcaA 3rd/4th domain-containing protein n=1 Tax=Kurthia senegalensis TaxID=1033740 RepID=UPI00028949AD|nr:zinc-ribbon domain-containing protein [Kurthia senegalensis]
MKHCTNCGKEIKDDLSFCPNCGQKTKRTVDKVSSEEASLLAKTAPTTEHPQSTLQASKPSSKKKKGLWITLIAVVALLAIAHFTIKAMIDPSKKIVAMHEAYQKEDAKAFLNEFTLEKDTHADADSFLSYMQGQDWSSVRQAMQENLVVLDKTDMADPITTEDDELIRLVKKDILGGLYHTVDFELIPIKQSVYNDDFDNIEFTTDGVTEKLEKEKATELGKFLPGDYKWSAVLTTEFGKLPFDGTMLVGGEADKAFELELNPNYATISSNNPDAILYVNGQSTEKTIYDENTIGPLPLDGSVKVQAIVKDGGKTYKTKEVKVQKSDIRLDFEYIAEQEQAAARASELSDIAYENESEVIDFYQSYRKAYESDLNNHVYDATSYYLQSGSKAEKELQAFFPQYVDGDEISNHTNNVASFKAIDTNTFQLISNEDYTFYSHEGPRHDYEYRRTYTIVKNGSNYVITNIAKQKISEEITDDESSDDY